MTLSLLMSLLYSLNITYTTLITISLNYETDLFLKVPDNLFREIDRNFNKLLRDLQNMDLPEATAYLRILGNELGYIKTSELESVTQNAKLYADIFLLTIPRTVSIPTAPNHTSMCNRNESGD